jgi:F0F1-type ATP synthase membrane subunit b/b'
MAATEKILGENVDDARNRKLVEEFIEKVEVGS